MNGVGGCQTTEGPAPRANNQRAAAITATARQDREKKEKKRKEKKREELIANAKVSDGGWPGNALLLQQGRTVGIAYHIV